MSTDLTVTRRRWTLNRPRRSQRRRRTAGEGSPGVSLPRANETPGAGKLDAERRERIAWMQHSHLRSGYAPLAGHAARGLTSRAAVGRCPVHAHGVISMGRATSDFLPGCEVRERARQRRWLAPRPWCLLIQPGGDRCLLWLNRSRIGRTAARPDRHRCGAGGGAGATV